MGIVSVLGEDFLGGHSLDKGVETIERLYKRGIELFDRPICSTFDVLGEEANSLNSVDRNLEAYSLAIKKLTVLRDKYAEVSSKYGIINPFSVSVKPSSISLFERIGGDLIFDKNAPLQKGIETLTNIDHDRKVPIAIDMEDHYWTYPTLKLIHKFLNHGKPIDPVLQACLDQTLSDVDAFLNHKFPVDKSKITVRACRGIYQEPVNIATIDKNESKDRLYALVEKLFEVGYFVGIATQDIKLKRKIKKDIIDRLDIPKNRYEYQGLLGIYSFADVILPEVLRNGEDARLYVPVELKPGDGDAYMRRRIKMNSEIAVNFFKDRAARRYRIATKQKIVNL